MSLTVTSIAPDTWSLDENGGVTLYLIAGSESAVLLDTGFDGAELPALVKSLTDKPVRLVHTHTHGDHTGGDALWGEVWLHPSEFDSLHGQPGHEELVLHPLNDGDVIELGSRSLEVIHCPGHTVGSIALLDSRERILFSGDTVMNQPVFLHGPDQSVSAFAASQKKLLARAGEFDRIYPCHDEAPLDKEAIEDLLACAEAVLDGTAVEQEIPIRLMTPEGEEVTIPFVGVRKGDRGITTKEPKMPPRD